MGSASASELNTNFNGGRSLTRKVGLVVVAIAAWGCGRYQPYQPEPRSPAAAGYRAAEIEPVPPPGVKGYESAREEEGEAEAEKAAEAPGLGEQGYESAAKEVGAVTSAAPRWGFGIREPLLLYKYDGSDLPESLAWCGLPDRVIEKIKSSVNDGLKAGEHECVATLSSEGDGAPVLHLWCPVGRLEKCSDYYVGTMWSERDDGVLGGLAFALKGWGWARRVCEGGRVYEIQGGEIAEKAKRPAGRLEQLLKPCQEGGL
jgi:hypothetical protein